MPPCGRLPGWGRAGGLHCSGSGRQAAAAPGQHPKHSEETIMTLASRIQFAACALLLAAGAAQAQQPNPLDVVPEKMPFDVPYGAPVSLERADAVLAEAVAESKSRSWKMNCAVVDSGGNLVSFKRMDGAQLASIDIALHKARAAAKYRRETKAFEGGV